MIRAKVLPDVLSQIVGDGVTATLLMTVDGALLGSVGSLKSETTAVDAKVVGAIVANVWGEYAQSAKEIFTDESLQVLFVNFDKDKCLGIISASPGYLLCAYSNGEAPLGLVKSKLEALQPFLVDALQQIQV
ncbi:Ragulator complex protein lamtor2 [Aphanomyces cochlioides]|nr:Ragulator complex protein lamtor2 [Aphanomyces cochlioides]